MSSRIGFVELKDAWEKDFLKKNSRQERWRRLKTTLKNHIPRTLRIGPNSAIMAPIPIAKKGTAL